MFSKSIFKQTLMANYKLWIIFTAILSLLSVMTIAVFDPKMISSMMDMVKNSPMADMMGDRLNGVTSLLGMIAQSLYTDIGVILPIIFIIITADSLIASQVDRGSMAYLLSTPTKRSTVVRTQALYMITSVFCMLLVVTIVGLSSVQIFQNGLVGKPYTEDVKATANVLNVDKKDVADDLTLILNNKDALQSGAEARKMDEEVYTVYLNLKTSYKAYQTAADELKINIDDVKNNPAIIKTNDTALTAAAKVMKMDKTAYSAYLDTMIAQKAAASSQSTDMQNKLLAGVTAAAKVLNKDASDLLTDMSSIKSNEAAMTAATEASGIPKEMLTSIINQQLAADAVKSDAGVSFDVKGYLILNLGYFLLMFAISSISFLFSCIFNLSKNSLALGAGIPVAFFIFQMMSSFGKSLKFFKYLSLNTLFNTNAITTGGSYWIQFIVLAFVGIVLYAVGMRVFIEKDLPL